MRLRLRAAALFFLLALSGAEGIATTTAVTVTPQASPVTVQQTGIIVAPDLRTVSATVAPLTAVTAVVEVPGTQGIPGTGTGTGEQVNADWLAVGTVAEILNKPIFNRGYDGKEIEVQKGTTAIQWRYLGDTAWIDLVSIATLTGAPGTNGKSYTCYITGGVQTLTYDKNGANPAPTMTAFAAEMRENGTVVTPATYSWSVPASLSLLSGNASGSTFTPTVAATYSAGSSDNRVDVVLTYSGVTCRAIAPVAVTKIGADGIAGSDTKQQIYTKVGVATTGDIFNTQAGSGDAAGFAFRTVRSSNGDIHRADLAGGQTYFYAKPTDTATSEKFGVKTAAGVTTSYFQADGSLVVKGSLVIK